MPLRIIPKYIPITDDMNVYEKLNAEIANNTVQTFCSQLEQTKMKELDPHDGREMIITCIADMEHIMKIKKTFIFPHLDK